VGAAEAIDLVVRTMALVGVGLAGAVAATHWAVRRGWLPAFGALARAVRSLGDPVLRPVERRLAGRGGNPQDAPLWLVGGAVVAGLLLILGTRWLVGMALGLVRLAGAGPLVWVRVALDWAIGVVMLALVIRVVAGWIGVSPWSRPMRLVHGATDWIVAPLRRVLPPMGILDLSPFVAYIALLLVRGVLLTLLP
jgi:YggT family protein